MCLTFIQVTLKYPKNHPKTEILIYLLGRIDPKENVYHQLYQSTQSEKPQEINTLLGYEPPPLNSLWSPIQLMQTLIFDLTYFDMVNTRVWYGLVSFGILWYGLVHFGMVWYGIVWYGILWYSFLIFVYFGMVWYCMWSSSIQLMLPSYCTRTL